jgi:hypothetical protein
MLADLADRRKLPADRGLRNSGRECGTCPTAAVSCVQNAENRRSSAFYPFSVTPQTAQLWVEPRELAILAIPSILWHTAPLGLPHYGSTHSPARLIPLENLDLVVDPKTNQVIPNPENGGKYTLDLL